ncbi:ATP-binding protein [Lyngbya aestuarii]|uniref:ATP-binding protein n=1 Tax=Lyngbya aestuarii TaxID=118322 RepID=UPI00403E1747
MELSFEPVRLDEVMSAVEKCTRNQLQQKNLSLNFELPATGDGIVVFGNYQQLLQILLKLVDNAIKFTPEGGVTISASLQKKHVKFKDQEFPGFVQVKVKDTGIGMDLEKQFQLFQSFTEVDGSTTYRYVGTGLGLKNSAKLVESMGGKIGFISVGTWCGSTAWFTVLLYREPLMIVQSEK